MFFSSFVFIAAAISIAAEPYGGGAGRALPSSKPPAASDGTSLITQGPGSRGSNLEQTPNQLIDSLPCVRFNWHVAPGVSDRAGIIFPVTIGEQTFDFQLDTGSHVSFIYGQAPAGGKAATSNAASVTVPSISIGDTTLPETKLYVRKDWPAGGGLLGLDVLLNRYTIIDYPRRRLCILNPEQMPEDLLAATRSAWGSLRGTKFYVPVVLNGETLADMFFDTGASMSHLMLEGPEWLKATGLKSTSEAPEQIEVQAWGGKTFVSRAPATGSMEVAGVELKAPFIDTLRDDPQFFQSNPSRTTGLIGNASFWDGIVILDLTPLMLFRFIPGEQTDAPRPRDR